MGAQNENHLEQQIEQLVQYVKQQSGTVADFFQQEAKRRQREFNVFRLTLDKYFSANLAPASNIAGATKYFTEAVNLSQFTHVRVLFDNAKQGEDTVAHLFGILLLESPLGWHIAEISEIGRAGTNTGFMTMGTNFTFAGFKFSGVFSNARFGIGYVDASEPSYASPNYVAFTNAVVLAK
jgi:hypothetical protein